MQTGQGPYTLQNTTFVVIISFTIALKVQQRNNTNMCQDKNQF